MRRLVECVPNFSEGRRKEVIDQIVAEITGVKGAQLLDVQMDADHNRAVVTFAGEPEPVEEAAFRAVKKAAELIDMEKHEGEHPRIGATDVVPFVPLRGVPMGECVQMAKRLGERIATELSIPVYLYERAATRPERADLSQIRRGEYEGLKETIESDPDREPDYGPRQLGKAGATVVGARDPLIAYNVYLNTDDVEIAQKIARAIRHSSGGLRYVKALGLYIAKRGLAQVSINMTNYHQTPLYRVFEMIRREAARYGVTVVGSEIVGLVLEGALLESAEYYLQLEGFSEEQVLERQPEVPEEVLVAQPKADMRAFLEEVASPSPTPGGGSVAALSGALAAALTSMACQLTLEKDEHTEAEKEMKAALEQARGLQKDLFAFIEEDAQAFEALLAAYRLPKDVEEEKVSRTMAVQMALRGAASVPLAVADRAVKLLEVLLTVAEKGNPNVLPDTGTATHMARAAVRGAALNVRANATSLADEELARAFEEQIGGFEERTEGLVAQIEALLETRL